MIEKSILRELVQAGAVLSLTARGVPGGYVLVVRTEGGDRLVGLQRGSVRVFSSLETVASFLRDVGAYRFGVDSETWSRVGLV